MSHFSRLVRAHGAYELRFQSLFNPGRALAFPCDAGGSVDMDKLSDRARQNYLFARAVVGRDFAAPAVHPGQA
ncbi:MAG: hypothetical protein ABI696_01420 [Rubrivivax sp.]